MQAWPDWCPTCWASQGGPRAPPGLTRPLQRQPSSAPPESRWGCTQRGTEKNKRNPGGKSRRFLTRQWKAKGQLPVQDSIEPERYARVSVPHTHTCHCVETVQSFNSWFHAFDLSWVGEVFLCLRFPSPISIHGSNECYYLYLILNLFTLQSSVQYTPNTFLHDFICS